MTDEENGEETCKVFSYCYSYRQMQRQGNDTRAWMPHLVFLFTFLYVVMWAAAAALVVVTLPDTPGKGVSLSH